MTHTPATDLLSDVVFTSPPNSLLTTWCTFRVGVRRYRWAFVGSGEREPSPAVSDASTTASGQQLQQRDFVPHVTRLTHLVLDLVSSGTAFRLPTQAGEGSKAVVCHVFLCYFSSYKLRVHFSSDVELFP